MNTFINIVVAGRAARRAVWALRDGPVAGVRRDAAHQHRAWRLHRAAGVRAVRAHQLRACAACCRAVSLLLVIAFGAGYAVQYADPQPRQQPRSAAVADRHVRTVDRDPERAAAGVLRRPALGRDGQFRVAEHHARRAASRSGYLPFVTLAVDGCATPSRCNGCSAARRLAARFARLPMTARSCN